MKIIHTADIHLDSPLSQVKDTASRRFELLRALSNMSEYANNNGVEAIIIAGDLFDDQFATAQTIESVASITNNSKANWYVLQGNHGSGAPYLKLKELSPKINLFTKEWTYYNLGNVTVCGRELGYDDESYYQRLNLDTTRYNIIVLHGDVDDESYGLINRKALSQSSAKYVALGHRHSCAEFKFGNVRACYSGTLESRGFDEPAQTGFILIDTETDVIKFVEQAIRRVETVVLDVTGITNDIVLHTKLADLTAEINNRNYLNVKFVGELNEGVHLSVIAKNTLGDRFFALRIEDNTTMPLDITALSQEVSLRGEFIKLAMELPDEKLRESVLKFGLQAISGEVLE